MRKKSHSRILKIVPKEQYISTVFKSCPNKYIQYYKHLLVTPCICMDTLKNIK